MGSSLASRAEGIHVTNETVGPRTKMAREAFRLHHEREPQEHDRQWIHGYVAALEDLPDDALAALEQVAK
jgi:hypothetical protein